MGEKDAIAVKRINRNHLGSYEREISETYKTT